MDSKDNVALLMAEQFRFPCEMERLDIIRKSGYPICADTNLPLGTLEFLEARKEGTETTGLPPCSCHLHVAMLRKNENLLRE